MAKAFLHMEGLAVLLVCLYTYQWHDLNWILFIVLFFTPDLAAFGYMIDVKVGAVLYNLVHTYTLSLSIMMIGFLFQLDIIFAIGIIVTAHIGMDRLCGFGLKYASHFKDTHLGRL